MLYAKPIGIFIILAISASTVYWLTYKTPEERIRLAIIEQNKAIEEANNAMVEAYTEAGRKCDRGATSTGSSFEILEKLSACANRQKPTLQQPIRNSGSGEVLVNVEKSTATGSVNSVAWYTVKHSLVLTGSHDYKIYSDRKGAGWKNNNSAGLTWWVSSELKKLWTDAGIKFSKWSPRPANEKWYYIRFETVEDWLRAKIIAIRERWGKATVQHYLSGWWTDAIDLSFSKSKVIKDLSDAEFTELFINQMKKETPGFTSQLVADWILVIRK